MPQLSLGGSFGVRRALGRREAIGRGAQADSVPCAPYPTSRARTGLESPWTHSGTTRLFLRPFSLLVLLLACAASSPLAAQSNVLVVLADDVGVDLIARYGMHSEPAATPTLDRLADEGVLFRNVWSFPTCSPARAALLSGRYPHHNGIGRVIRYLQSSVEFDPALTTWPDRLARSGYRCVALGKWHLSAAIHSASRHPRLCGFEHHFGIHGGLGPLGTRARYDRWWKWTDDLVEPRTTYVTSENVDDALEWADTHPEPWCIWLGFYSAHRPFHRPPAHLHDVDLSSSSPPREKARAMVEAMDRELGRLLASMDPRTRARTTILFLGDNGTDSAAATPPLRADRAKGSLYQGGILVPMILSGAGVARRARGREARGLVDVVDIYPTILDIAGLPELDHGLDGVSFAKLLHNPARRSEREFSYSEVLERNVRPGAPARVERNAARDRR